MENTEKFMYTVCSDIHINIGINVCMYVHLCMALHTYTYMVTHVATGMPYICMHACMYIRIHAYIYVHIYIHTYGTPHKKVYISYRSKYSYLRSSSYVPYFTLTPYVRTCWSTRSTRIPA